MSDQIIRSNKLQGYSIVDNTVLRDDRLSWKAKGILCYILSLPTDWKISINELISHATDGELAFRNGITELEKYGYFIRERCKSNDGKFAGFNYKVIENPNCSPYGDFPPMDNPPMDNPPVDNHVLLSTKELNTKKVNTKKTSSKDAPLSNTGLLPKVSKATQKGKDVVTMKGMMEVYTSNELVKEALTDYFNIRLKTGLNPNQWAILLEDLRDYAKDDANLAVDKIRSAIAGGYRQIIAPWELKSSMNRVIKNKVTLFDNTHNSTPTESVVNMTPEELEKFNEDLAVDENGNPITF